MERVFKTIMEDGWQRNVKLDGGGFGASEVGLVELLDGMGEGRLGIGCHALFTSDEWCLRLLATCIHHTAHVARCSHVVRGGRRLPVPL